MDYSIVVPVFKAEATLPELYRRLVATMAELGRPFELIFVDDNSPDGSWELLRSLRDDDSRVRCYQLMRNYGQQNATMCGMRQARGRFIITLDDDLQNPPEEIPLLLAELEKGYDVVYAVYDLKRHGWYRRLGSRLVNKFFTWTFPSWGPVSAFRALRTELAQRIFGYDLNFTHLNGLMAWYTDRVSRVVVRHDPRGQGRSGYTFGRLLGLSINLMTNFSLRPLQVATYVGLLFATIGFGMGAYFILKKWALDIPVNGFTAIIVSISFFSGMILVFLGIIGEYLGRIHMNINRKPQFSIRPEAGHPPDESS